MDHLPNKIGDEDKEVQDEEHNLSGSLGLEYQTFRDEDATIIFDVDEEKKKMIDMDAISTLQEVPDLYEGLNMKRKNKIYSM